MLAFMKNSNSPKFMHLCNQNLGFFAKYLPGITELPPEQFSNAYTKCHSYHAVLVLLLMHCWKMWFPLLELQEDKLTIVVDGRGKKLWLDTEAELPCYL